MFQLTPFSLSIFIATVVNIFTALVSWKRRNTAGGIYFASAMLGITFWSLMSALDYAAVPLSLKIFFAKLEYLGYLPALSLMTAFSFVYAGREESLKEFRLRALLILVPVVGILLTWTNEWHHWIWTDFIPSGPKDNIVDFVHGPAFTGLTLGGYLIIVLMVRNLLQVAITGIGPQVRQARLMLAALTAPVAGNLLYLFDAFNTPGVDWSAVTFSITGILFLIALFGSRFMEIVPTARNTMIEQMNNGVLVIDDQGRLVDFNPAAQAIFGINQKDLWNPFQGSKVKRLSELSTLFENPSEKSSQDIGIGQKNYIVQRIPLADFRGHIFGQLLDIYDITERKKAMDELEKREEEFRELITSAADAFVVVNTEGRIVLANKQAAALFGYEVEELVGSRVEMLLPMRYHGLHTFQRAEYAAQHRSRPAGSRKELAARHKDGHEFSVEISLSTLKTSAGMFISADIRDVSERKRMETELRNRNEALATLQQTMLDLVNRHDVDDILQTLLLKIGSLMNARHVSIDLIEEPDTLVTRAVTPGQALEKGDRMRRGEGGWLSWQAMETGQPAVLEDYSTWARRRELYTGLPVHAIAIIPIHQRERVIGTINFSRDTPDTPFNVTDIYAAQQLAQMVALVLDNANLYTRLQHELAERIQKEAELLKTQARLIEQQKSLAVIEERQRTARDLHDSVSQSLHSLNLFSETMVASLEKDNKEHTLQLADRLRESARQALKEARLMLYQFQPSELDAEVDLVREIEERFSSVEERAGVRASLQVEGDASHCPQAWRENLFRITIEVLNNSLKHALARNVKITLRCDLAAVEINITDDGIGFDQRRARKGGMGMRTMRERADLLGGVLEIKSSPGAGTSVSVRVERQEPQ